MKTIVQHSMPQPAFHTWPGWSWFPPPDGLSHAFLFPTVPLRAWVGWHLLPDVGPEGTQCASLYLLKTGQSPVIAPIGKRVQYKS
jgi:hypothetical protein